MAIYHLHVKNISRGSGRSVVAAAAYRAGETLPNEAEERVSAFGGRRDVLHNEIVLPDGAPDWMADRARLWNAVEAVEKRKDARLAKEIEVALPRELSKPVWMALARQLAAVYAAKGFVADFALHDDGTAHNPHVHMLLTTRVIESDGFGGKIRSADGRQFVEDARALWGKLANEALVTAGLGVAVDPRSHAQAGIDRVPTEHRGPDAAERRLRRENMAFSRKLPRSTAPTSQQELDRMLDNWPASQFERRAERDQDLPVPDPDGNAISSSQLEEAQERMVSEMERKPFDMSQSQRWAVTTEPEPRPSSERDQAQPVREPFDMSQSRRWAASAEPALSPLSEPERPLVSKRWETETPDREHAETRESGFQSSRWAPDADREPEGERGHDMEWQEPVHERVQD